MVGPGRRSQNNQRCTRSSTPQAQMLAPPLEQVQTVAGSSNETPSPVLQKESASAEELQVTTGRNKRGPTRNLALAKKRIAGQKVSLDMFVDDGRIVGLECQPVINEIGCVIRKKAPLNVPKWAKLDEVERETLLKMVEGPFEVDDSQEFKKALELQMQRQYRCNRHRLHIHFLRFPSLEAALQNPPEGILEDQWQHLCHYFTSPEFKKISDRNKKNRQNQKSPHTTGTKSYNRKIQEEATKIGRAPTLVEFFKLTKYNDKKRTWVTEEAKKEHEEMEQELAQSQAEGAEPMNEGTIVEKVLGPKSSYLRRHGANQQSSASSSKRQIEMELEETKKRAEQAEQRSNELATEMQELRASQTETNQLLQSLLAKMQNGSSNSSS